MSDFCPSNNDNALLWNSMQRRIVVSYRRFGTTNRSHFQGPSTAFTGECLESCLDLLSKFFCGFQHPLHRRRILVGDAFGTFSQLHFVSPLTLQHTVSSQQTNFSEVNSNATCMAHCCNVSVVGRSTVFIASLRRSCVNRAIAEYVSRTVLPSLSSDSIHLLPFSF